MVYEIYEMYLVGNHWEPCTSVAIYRMSTCHDKRYADVGQVGRW